MKKIGVIGHVSHGTTVLVASLAVKTPVTQTKTIDEIIKEDTSYKITAPEPWVYQATEWVGFNKDSRREKRKKERELIKKNKKK